MNRTLVLAAVALILLLAGALLLFGQGEEPIRSAPATASPPAGAAAPDQGAGPTNSFIVCPGNPRCPKGKTGGD